MVGNVMTRGQPVIEALLESGLPYLSGTGVAGARGAAQDRWVLAVAGTHGKTTTASLLAWILEHAGLEPGFLIGGVPANFGVSARLGAAPFFVIEADEYDTAFFDKRAKFVHYRPRTVILNNLEFDHADIYPDVAAIQRQFHHLVRTVPGSGRIVWNAADARLAATLAMGCWTPLEGFARSARPGGPVERAGRRAADFSRFEVLEAGRPQGTVEWPLIGAHNVENALAAIAAARHAGVPVPRAIAALRAVHGRRAPHAAARRGARRARVRRLRAPPDRHRHHHRRACASAVGARRASSRCSSRARTPCAWVCTGIRSRPRSRAPTKSGCIRPPTWAGTRRRCWPPSGRAGMPRSDVATLSRELARSVRSRRSRAHHEQRRLRRPARQAPRAASGGRRPGRLKHPGQCLEHFFQPVAQVPLCEP